MKGEYRLGKRISLLFVFLLFFQTITNGFVAPAQITAQGSKASIFTGISFTDEDGKNENGESTVTVYVDWSIKDVAVEAGYTQTESLPEKLSIDSGRSEERRVG